MESCTLIIQDQVNCSFKGLDPHIRKKFTDALKFMVPSARHTPAFKLGRWDGKVSFGTASGSTYINMLDRVLPLIMDNYEIEIDDQRPQNDFVFPEVTEAFVADRCWPEGHTMAGQPIMLRDYQVEAIGTYFKNLQSVQSISTGAGKTLLTACLSLQIEPYGRSIVIVPSKSLVEQTEEDYLNLGLDVGVFFGDRKEWNKTHTICTWQSLSVYNKRTKKAKKASTAKNPRPPLPDEVPVVPIDVFLEGVVAVIIDECHGAKGPELLDLLCGPMAHIPIRWGLTGTVPKEDYEFMALLSSIGPVVGEVRASDLQEKGVLANCQVKILQLQDTHVEFKDYDSEYSFIVRDLERLQWIGEHCITLAAEGNTLILVDRIDTGEILASIIPDSIFVNGATKTKDRRKEYKEIQTSDNKTIIATYGVASVGINIPRIFNLVLFEPGKSFIRVIQSIGRGIRKAEDKDFVQITDFSSSLKFAARQIPVRKKFYKEANYPFTVTKVNYRGLII